MSEPAFSLSKAAKICGVSRNTLYRHIEQLRALGATRNEQGWNIPISALIAAGLAPRKTPPDKTIEHALIDAEVRSMKHPYRAPSEQLSEQIQQLKKELEETHQALVKSEMERRIAETQAYERQVTIEAQKAALRLLEGAKTSAESTQQLTLTNRQEEAAKKRRWWQRKR